MLQQQLLGSGGQIKQLTIAGQRLAAVLRGRAAVAGVIVHRACADLVQLDGVRPRPIVVGVSQQADFAFSLEKFIGFRCKFCSKFNGHKFNLA